ncbi:MAG: response regulator [Desulfonatronovibrionaceae bacterium]
MTSNSKTTIMIIDDTPANLGLLQEMLESKGFKVVAFPSGQLAFKAAVRKPPDLILLDIKMPDMDGYQVCQKFKQDELLMEIPIIFISALGETTDKIKAFSVGGVDYVTKPFEPDEVYARVDTHLKIRFLQEKLEAQNQNLEQMVQERTRELSQAHEKLRQVDRVKDNFLHMISHEIRTPANGVLGMTEIILDICPETPERKTYQELFHQSSRRLMNLIEDATLLAGMDSLETETSANQDFSELLKEVQSFQDQVRISIGSDPDPGGFVLKGDPALLKKVVHTFIHLGAAFSHRPDPLNIKLQPGDNFLKLVITVDNLSLSSREVGEFFELESPVRSASLAQTLGLAPVVAGQLLQALGGAMTLTKTEEEAGRLEAKMPLAQTRK